MNILFLIFLIVIIYYLFRIYLYLIDNSFKESFDKPRVAICLRGAISKGHSFFNQGDLYSAEPYLDYKKCYRTIMKYIVEPNQVRYDIDFICHGWNVDLQDDLVDMYKPKKFLFENNNDYKDYISSLCEEPGDFSCVSQGLSIKKVIELKEEYEKEIGKDYDLVLLYRYDIVLWKPIVFDNYDTDKIYVNAHEDSNGDFHFVMNKENASEFKYLIDSIDKGNKCITHYWIKNYVNNYMKKELISDDILPAVHQEVIRKIDAFSIEPGRLSQEDFDKM